MRINGWLRISEIHTVWRIFWNSVLFLSLFWAPPIFTFVLGAALLFFFPRFYEFLIAAFLADALYGTPTTFFGGFQLVFTVTALFVFVCAAVLKRRMRFY